MPTKAAWTRSLRARLTLWYTGALACILVAAALGGHAAARRALLAETDNFLRAEAGRIAGATAREPGADELAESLALPRQTARGSFDVVYAVALDPQTGQIVAQSPALAAEPTVRDRLTRTPAVSGLAFLTPRGGPKLRVWTQPLTPGRLTLRLAVSYERRADLLERLDRTLAVALPLVLALAAVGGWLLVGRTLHPIGRIVREAERLDPQAPPPFLLPAPRETDSELGGLVAALNAMTARLHQSFAVQRRFASAQQRFAADASHELRTPLTILRGEMDLALSRPRSAETYQKTLASAVEEIDRLSRIVEGLSFLARRDGGQLAAPPVRAPVRLTALVETVRADFAARAAEKNVTLRVEKADETADVTGDAGQLRQLVANLTENALNYTPPGGCVRLTVGRDEKSATVQVADTGIGLSEDDLTHVFERFWRADRARQSGGSGLGLAICKEIAHAHGGELTAQSAPGAGSVFTLRLPSS